MTWITNARLPREGGALWNVLVENGRIAQVLPANGPATADALDAGGRLLSPGWIEIQINGAYGLDFTEQPESIWPVGARLPEMGLTTFLPTVVTSPLETAAKAQRALLEGRPAGYRGATPLGLHLEGPFLNPGKKGAHNPVYLRPPEAALVANWSVETGVRLATLAPELPGALDVIRVLTERGVVVSAGHSLATYDQARAAFNAGARCGTHLFNAMPSMEGRLPGLIGALLTHESACFGIIVDGIHVHPAMVDLAWRAAGRDRLILVTDAMAALGNPPGVYGLGHFTVTVDETSARLADGTLAGSILLPAEALRNLMAYTGCGLDEALACITERPARLLGIADRKGRVAEGYDADFTLIDDDCNIAWTMVGGEVVYRAA